MPYETGELYETGLETLEPGPFEAGAEGASPEAADSPFSEVEEMELAAQLLEVTDEAELDQFIGKLFRKAAGAVGRALKTPVGRQLGGLVKGAIKQALPGVGAAVGGAIPRVGRDLGGRLATRAGQLLGLELEGLSPEDQEFETARQLVRLVGGAARHAATAPAAAPAISVARQSLARAARHFAPGLLPSLAGGVSSAAAGSFEGETAEEYEEEYEGAEGAGDFEAGNPFSEVEEMELAAQLLEVTDEAELDQFIGGLLKRAARAARKVIRSPLGQHLGGLVKGAVKQALPGLGAAVGGAIPGVGRDLGGQLATRASQLLGLELEGLSPEDQEFEAAKQLVRLAGAAVQNVPTSPAATASPATAAQTAVVKAARQHAPGLVRGGDGPMPGACHCRRRTSGRWLRRGGKIILLGT
jgi:hypothetical protein